MLARFTKVDVNLENMKKDVVKSEEVEDAEAFLKDYDKKRREEMGRIGQRRVDAYFHHEQMLANYRKMYDETAKEYHLE